METIDWGIFLVAAVIFVVSGISVLYHMVKGVSKTGLSSKYVWGLNIQFFYVLSSFGTGLMAVMSILIITMGDLFPAELFRLGGSVALACLISAMVLTGSDLGRPMRAMKMLVGKRYLSPLSLDFFTLGALVILSLIISFGLGLESVVAMKIWAYISLIIAILCMASHTLLVSSRFESGFMSRPFFATETIVAAFWGGTAILTLLAGSGPLQTILLSMLLVISAIALMLAFSSAISVLLGKGKVHNRAYTVLVLVTFLILIIGDLGSFNVAMGASILALISIVVEKTTSIMTIQKRSVVPEPYSMLDKDPEYTPTKEEVVNLVFSLSILIVLPYAVSIILTYIS